MLIFRLLNDLATGRSGLGGTLRTFLLGATLNAPVENVVVLIALADEEVTEQLAQVRVVGLVIEAQSTRVVEEDAKFVGETSAEQVGRGSHLLLHDAIVLLLLGGGLETLPGKGTAEEVHEDIRQRLKVITASLLNSQMSVDGGVTGSASEVLVLPVGDVKVGLGVAELLCETEVNDVYLVTALADTHQKVVWLDIAVDKVARVDVLDAGDL